MKNRGVINRGFGIICMVLTVFILSGTVLSANPETANSEAGEKGEAVSQPFYYTLTKEEQEYIQKKEKIVVGFYNCMEPFSHDCTTKGDVEGIYDTLLQKMEQLSGIELEPYLIDNSEYGPDLIEEGTIDFFIGQVKEGTDADHIGLVSTEPLFSSDAVLITRNQFQFQEGKEITLGLPKGRDYWRNMVKVVLPEAKIKFFATPKDCLLAVKDGLADATVLNTMEFNYQSKNSRFKTLIERGNYRISTDIVLMASKDAEPAMISIINKIIGEVPKQDSRDIINYYMNLPYHTEDFNDKLYAARGGLIIVGIIFVFLVILAVIVFWIRRQSFHMLEEKNEQLKKANQVKMDFLSNMSHEMRTPINVILGLTELVMEETEKETVADALQKIKSAGRLLLIQINDILDITKIERTNIVLNPEAYYCGDFAEQIQMLMEPLTKQKNQKLCVDLSGMEKDWFLVDKVRFNQIFFNLLSNSVKYTPELGKIEFCGECIERREETARYCFGVKDNGIGMSEEFLTHMGEPFVRENNETTKVTEGSGLGIYIVKQLVYAMGGRMTVQSEKGKGTVIRVELEIKVKDGPPPEKILKQKVVPDKKEEKPFLGFRALICEDHPVNGKIAAEFLKRLGVESDIAKNGKEGVEMLIKSPDDTYGIVFMDMRMPIMDGLEATERIRKEERAYCKNIPIVAMTANAFEEDKERGRKAGMNDHLVKPLEKEELYRVLETYLP